MRALIHDGQRPRLTTSHPDPSPQPGEALVRPRRAGVSRLDLLVARGEAPHRGVMGQEFVGVVEGVAGADERGLTGRRVVASASSFCRTCDMCLAGLREHCRGRRTLGLDGCDGCLADLFVVPVECLQLVPDSVDDDHAVFAEPLAAAIQVQRRLTIEGRPFITVLGDGPMGLLTVQVLARLNASVRLVGRSAGRLAVCEKWGIKHRQVDEVGRRRDQDVVVDCTGDERGLRDALALVRPRGKVVLQAPPTGAATSVLSALVENENEILGSHRGPVRDAVMMLARGEVDVVSLISRRMALEDGPALLAASEHDPVMKVLVGF